MPEVKRYHVTEAGLVEGAALGRINVVLGADHDRVTAEREALQQSLTVADDRLDVATTLLRETSKVLRGGDCYGWENNQADSIDAFLANSTRDICTWVGAENAYVTGCGKEWVFHDDGPIENDMKFCHSCGKTLAVEPAESA